MKTLLLIAMFILSTEVYSQELNLEWEILPNVELGKINTDSIELLESICQGEDCFIIDQDIPSLISGIKVRPLNKSLLQRISGANSYAELEKMIQNSTMFSRSQENSGKCKVYVRHVEHSSPHSYGMSESEFTSIYDGYVLGIGWKFHENQIVKFCGDSIWFFRKLSF